MKRPLSYSQLASWEWSKDGWFDRYVLGHYDPPDEKMKFGSVVGDSIGTPESLVPDLTPPGVKEYKLTATMDGVDMVGYADHYCPDTLILHENKTSDNPKQWTQGKADKHKQIDMYLLLLYLSEGTPPESVTCYLNFIETKPVGVGYRLHEPPQWQQFTVRPKTMDDIEVYTKYIFDTLEEMDAYVRTRRLSTPAPRPPVYNG